MHPCAKNKGFVQARSGECPKYHFQSGIAKCMTRRAYDRPVALYPFACRNSVTNAFLYRLGRRPGSQGQLRCGSLCLRLGARMSALPASPQTITTLVSRYITPASGRPSNHLSFFPFMVAASPARNCDDSIFNSRKRPGSPPSPPAGKRCRSVATTSAGDSLSRPESTCDMFIQKI